jgi:hypothetical protein
MGSGFASVRAGDGICGLHDMIMTRSGGCTRFQASWPAAATVRQ